MAGRTAVLCTACDVRGSAPTSSRTQTLLSPFADATVLSSVANIGWHQVVQPFELASFGSQGGGQSTASAILNRSATCDPGRVRAGRS
jgi:hypothetical protein